MMLHALAAAGSLQPRIAGTDASALPWLGLLAVEFAPLAVARGIWVHLRQKVLGRQKLWNGSTASTSPWGYLGRCGWSSPDPVEGGEFRKSRIESKLTSS